MRSFFIGIYLMINKNRKIFSKCGLYCVISLLLAFVLGGPVFMLAVFIVFYIVTDAPEIQDEELMPEGYLYRYSSGSSAIGIGKNKDKVLLKAGGKSKVYDASDLRGHEVVNYEAGSIQFIEGGVGHHFVSGVVDSIRSSINKEKKSGLFVYVRDVDNPEWRIKILKSNDQKKWNEILNELYEGTLK